MTLERAIKIQEQYSKAPESVSLEDETASIQLGIGALKREQWNRLHPAYPEKGLLLGETKE